MTPATERIYLHDDHCHETPAIVLAVDGARFACDRTCCYPGGGGQPPDLGVAVPAGAAPLPIVSASLERRIVWHQTDHLLPRQLVGRDILIRIDSARREALTRGHTALHILNTLALRQHGAWITGAQIGVDYSRIDFNFEFFTQAGCQELEKEANRVIGQDLPLRARNVGETEFHTRPDLLRTLDVRPPVEDGKVRVVEICGFDEQACGGTHVPSTGTLGRLKIFKMENKGRSNKRLYVRLQLD